MRFVYKIHSGYDGFTPLRIPDRMIDGDKLELGWGKYIDEVTKGDEVWIYFKGPHKFVEGIYLRGTVKQIQREKSIVVLKIMKDSMDRPLEESRIKDLVSKVPRLIQSWGLQVFPIPTDWITVDNCTMDGSADTCAAKRCEGCSVWKSFQLIENFYHPEKLGGYFADYIPAYWIIPSRCFVNLGVIRKDIRIVSNMFSSFKMGKKEVAFPLALGIYYQLKTKGIMEFDGIVPVPLSPDKIQRQELNRPKVLANELSELIGFGVFDYLSLKKPISKRSFLSAGLTQYRFELEYYDLLNADSRISNLKEILLVDDVCTRGSTLTCCARKLRDVNPNLEIVAATAGQMITKPTVKTLKEIKN